MNGTSVPHRSPFCGVGADLPRSRCMFILIFDLAPNYGPSIIPKEPSTLVPILAAETSNITKIGFIIAAKIKRTPKEPIRETTISHLTVREGTNPEYHHKSLFPTQLYEAT
jgi:hypothetical protein